MLRLLFSIVAYFLFCNAIFPQDIHFSQYEQAPLLLNPALTGNCEGDWRAGLNFREQWTTSAIPYNTFNVFFDKKVFVYSKIVMAGGYITLDQLNADGLTKVSVAPSFAYRVGYRKNIFTFGLQPGIGFYNLNKVLSHPDQFNYETGTFDSGLPTDDISEKYSKLFPDINVGLTWSRPVYGLFPYFGLAMYHINSPKNSLYNDENKSRMPIKTLINFGIPIAITSRMIVSPSALLIRQRKSQEVDLGADCTFSLPKNSSKIDNIFVGAHYRNARTEGFNSVVFIGGLKYYNLSIAISYDEYFNTFNYSSLLGKSFEVSIIYTGLNSFTDKFSIPCDVY